MSLFARILSHGFGLVVVVMLGLGLVYRGDLFPGMELPEFLAVERAADSAAGGVSGSVTRGETASADDGKAPGPVDRQATTDEAGSVPDTQAKTVDSMTIPPMTAPKDGAPVSPDEGSTHTPAMAANDVTASDEGDVEEEAKADRNMREVPVVAPSATDSQTPAATSPPVAAPVVPADGSALVATPPASTGAAAPDSTATEATTPDTAATEAATPDPTAQAGTIAGSASAVPGQADAAADVGSTAIDDQPAETARATGKPAESPYRLLAAAREAYWLRDYDTAEQKYRAMIDLDPTNPDGFGELGNMYFSQGKWELASATYFEAGKRLADEGLFEQARQLVDVLRGCRVPRQKHWKIISPTSRRQINNPSIWRRRRTLCSSCCGICWRYSDLPWWRVLSGR
jgi:hypothetical protein